MKTVMEACTPRRGILQGTFNPEVFTAALGPVMQFYRSGSGAIDSIYTDAEAFSGRRPTRRRGCARPCPACSGA